MTGAACSHWCGDSDAREREAMPSVFASEASFDRPREPNVRSRLWVPFAGPLKSTSGAARWRGPSPSLVAFGQEIQLFGEMGNALAAAALGIGVGEVGAPIPSLRTVSVKHALGAAVAPRMGLARQAGCRTNRCRTVQRGATSTAVLLDAYILQLHVVRLIHQSGGSCRTHRGVSARRIDRPVRARRIDRGFGAHRITRGGRFGAR